MNKNNLFWSCMAAGTLLLLFTGVWLLGIKKSADNFSPRAARIGARTYVLEKARSDAERKKGLSKRESLCGECGMLFVFEQPGQYAFWMKDMLFPLDIIWLLGGRVVFVAHGVAPDFSGVIEPGVLADQVIEINTGEADGLKLGEMVEFLR